MAGRAPVDSPTSIMSIDRLGKMPASRSAPESDCPSRTNFTASSRTFFSTGVPSESAAVLSACISGIPPTKRVPSTRENCAT